MRSILNKSTNSLFRTTKKYFSNTAPTRVAITGATGNIAYSMAFRIASGELLGKNTPVIVHLVDIPPMADRLKGVKMELDDCAFPTLVDTVCSTDYSQGFKDIDIAFLVGSKPRGPGMERADLLKQNGAIFVDQGKALSDYASRDGRVLVVGNPANTNCLIAMKNAKSLNSRNFHAMTRLDHNRALAELGQKTNTPITNIHNLTIWGNHSGSMFPDLYETTVNGKPALECIDREWYEKTYIPEVAQRGAAIIKARGASSAASAGNAAMDHMRDWVLGTKEVVSMSVPSDGIMYGVPKDLIFSFPATCQNGDFKIVEGLKHDEFQKKMIKRTTDELLSERNEVEHLL